MTVLSNHMVKARKAHRCGLCGRPIVIRDLHRRAAVRDGGVLGTFRFHQECDALTVLDKWDWVDWEGHNDHALFLDRLQQVRQQKGEGWWVK